MFNKDHKNKYSLFFAFVILIASIVYSGYHLSLNMNEAKEKIVDIQSALNESENRIESLEEDIVTLEHDNSLLEEALQNERDRNDSLQETINDISGELDIYQKLDELDPELLKKYSKVYFLSEHYEPTSLSDIPEEYLHEKGEENVEKIHAEVLPFLVDMMEDISEEGIDLSILSGYRSFQEQSDLKEGYTVLYGEGANTFAADQGYSEHQLGTAIDFITSDIDRSLEGFENTEAYQWLLDHAYKYGFIISYPENNDHYVFEPWHWRFVGRELAGDINRSDNDFYDMNQRNIDEYLLNIFE